MAGRGIDRFCLEGLKREDLDGGKETVVAKRYEAEREQTEGKESESLQEGCAALGWGPFISSKTHLCVQQPEGRGVRESMSVSVHVPCGGTERWPLRQRWSESVFGSRRKQDGSGFYPFPRDAQGHFVLGRNDRMFYLFQTSRRHDLIWFDDSV